MKAAELFPHNSIRRKLLLGVLLIGIPPLAVLFYQNYYALAVLRMKAGESYMNAVSQRLEQIDGNLGAIDLHLRALADSDTDVLTMAESDDENAYRLAKMRFGRRLTESALTHPHAELFFAYSPRWGDFLEVFSAGGTFTDRMRMRDVVRGGVIIGPPGFEREREWRVVLIGGSWFLIRAVRSGSVVLGAWCRLDRLLENARAFTEQQGTTLLFTNEYGDAMTDVGSSGFTRIEQAGIHERAREGEDGRRYLIVGASSQVAPVRLHAVIDDRTVVRNLPNLRWVFLTVTAATAVLFAFGSSIMLRKTIISPLDRMLRAITSIREGKASGRIIPIPAADEFRRVTDAFNAMMGEIDELRISVYEEQLAIHREELLRLRAQVDPHFFLNSINMVYSLVAKKDYGLVSQAMTLLSNYFSFSVRNSAEFIPLGEELEHIEDYVGIQKLRFNGEPQLCIDAPGFLLEQPIPPLIVLSFVENSFRHGQGRRKSFKLSIEADHRELDGKEYVSVRVEDNGAGFSEAYLAAFREANRRDESKDHIGIRNAQRRLELIYKGQAKLEIGNTHANGKIGGAWTSILIPFAESGKPIEEAAS